METTEKTAKMTLTSLTADFAIYNLWANQTMVEWLRPKPAEVLEQIVPSSFPSLKETLVHIWDTQRFWMAVLKQVAPPQSFRMGFEGTLEDVMEGIVDQSRELAIYIKFLGDDALTEEVELRTPWASGIKSRVEWIQHCLSHSCYHRGQLVTIARNAVITSDIPMTDYSFYMLNVRD
ncbi:MAG TPA: DinB family protein [Cyclobacteriaceae bacterium]|nr:DinB family protein [Cyclobacteriaceae bacterium]